jgi:NAD(P)-dependent dehydrogenase (short-subunit alcohol dehydrogenase family)
VVDREQLAVRVWHRELGPAELERADQRVVDHGTNHLGHLALALGLHDALAVAEGARIVALSSVGHLESPVVLDDLDFHRLSLRARVAYGQSKTANALFAVEATRRWSTDGITANAVHPGAILDTKLTRHLDPDRLAATVASSTYRFKTREQGAATSVLAAAWPALAGIGGRYFEDCNEAEVVDPESRTGRFGVAPYALDPEQAQRLWDVSLRLLGR